MIILHEAPYLYKLEGAVHKISMSRKIKILPYRGTANSHQAIVKGHLFKKHPVKELKVHHRRFSNFRNAVRRYQLSPLKYQEILVKLGNDQIKVETDNRGFFQCNFRDHKLTNGWHEYSVHYNGKSKKGELVYPPERSTAVISDIDDTVLVSHSTLLLKKLYLMLFRNAHSRKPTPLIKNWSRHLLDFNANQVPEDFFYVSNSEWNLYDFIEDFFSINELPKGVFFLQNLRKGLKDLVKSGRVNAHHKMESIQFLFRFYPQKDFILVGDNGQKDMHIYSKICDEYPERVKGVMIRKLAYVVEKYRMEHLKEKLDRYHIPLVTYH